MPIEAETISIALAKGLNTKTDPKQLMPGELSVLQNGIFTSPQEICKRNGMQAIQNTVAGGGTISAGNSLSTFNDVLLINDGTTLYDYSPTLQENITIAQIPALSLATDSIAQQSSSGFLPSTAVHSSGLSLTALNSSLLTADSSLLQLVLFDANTNERQTIYSIFPQTVSSFSGVDAVRTLVIGPNFIVLAAISTGGTSSGNLIIGAVIPAVTAVPSVTFTTIITGLSPTTFGFSSGQTELFLDAAVLGNNYYIGYVNASGLSTIAEVNGTTVLNTATPGTASNLNSLCVTTDVGTNTVWFTYAQAPNIFGIVYNPSLTVLQGPTAVSTVLAVPLNMSSIVLNGTTLWLYSGGLPTTLGIVSAIAKVIWVPSTGTITTVSFVSGIMLASKPFQDNAGNVYIAAQTFSVEALQNTYFILKDLATNQQNSFLICGRFGVNSGDINAAFTLPSVLPIPGTTNEFIYPYNLETSAEVVSGFAEPLDLTFFQGTFLRISFGTKIQSVNLALNTNYTSGFVYIYDGVGVAESLFHQFPDHLELRAIAKPPGVVTIGINAGTYSYIALFEWLDNEGNIVRSAPSQATSITIATSNVNNVLVLVQPLFLSTAYKLPEVRIKLYRTTNGGPVYFLVAEASNSDAIAESSLGIAELLTDNLPDTSIEGSQQLYTTGGEVENIGPPSFSSMASYKNRIIGITAENPYVLWYSKQVIAGFPVEFSDLFTQNIDMQGGPMVAVATMDTTLIIFKEYNIFYMSGTGPSPAGTNNDFTFPQIITTDVGCNNPNSIVLMPSGLMFQSHKGIYLLDRSLGVSYIGASVESFNSQAVVSATLIPYTTQVRFLLGGGGALMFDYLVQQWGQFNPFPGVDTIICDNVFTILQSGGLVLQETIGQFTDNGAPIVLSMTFGWMSFAKVQGYQRFRKFLILGESESNTTLTATIAYNFDSTIIQTDNIVITGSQIPIQYRVFPIFQKCEAFQISFSDLPSAPLGEGLRLSNFAMEVGVKRGLNKMPAAQSYG
jgi:hypothetical protein